MALFNTFGVNRWLKFEVLRKSDGAGANDRDDRAPSNNGGYATSTPPKPAPTPAPTNQYSSAAYVDSQGREFGQTYSSDPNQKPTQVDKITDVAGYGQGDGNQNDNNTTASYGNAAAAVLGGGAEVAPVLGKVPKPGTPATSIPEGFKPPDGAATFAFQTWTNMDTGETWTANTGGWTAPNANWTTNPDKWVKDNAVAEAAAAEAAKVAEAKRLAAAETKRLADEAAAETKRLADEASAAAEAARQGKIKELEDALSASKGLYGELQDKYGKTQEEYTGLKSNFEELFGNYGTLTGTYDEQKAAYDDLYGQYDTLESRLGDYNTQLADQKTNYESLMGQYSDLTGQYEDTTSLYDTLQSDFSGLQGTLAEQQAAYEAQKAAAEKNRVLGIAEKATSGAAKPDPRYTQPAQTAFSGEGHNTFTVTPAYTPVAANQGAQSLTPGATPYGITPIDYAANMPDFMNNPLDLSIPSFGATGQNAPPPIGGPMQQVTPMMDYSAPFQPYLQSINQQYGVNIPSAYTGIMAGGRQ
jgi:predicted nuclease with TOPRIM domain